MDRTVVCLKSTAAADLLSSQIEAAGWQIEVAEDVESAHALIHERRHCVGLIEFSRKHLNGQARGLEWLLRSTPGTGWIGLTASDLVPALLQQKLIPGFLFDYHTLPLDPLRLVHSMGHAYGMARANRVRGAGDPRSPGAHGLIGASPVMDQVLRDIRKIALVDAPVMLSGESGTGKELAAQAIHRLSERRDGPFTVVNCGAIPAELIQSVLFGHERGAFTGAHQRHIGRIEAAHGGTVFLDEIGDLPCELQINLLRFLQESTIERLGGTGALRVDVRVIAASHIDLQEAASKGHFREDLYYRLNVLRLRMPPLRERQSDIELLAHHFFAVFAKERHCNVRGFSPDALGAIREYHWPGNVRELMNRVRRATIMCEQNLISPAALDLSAPEHAPSARTLLAARGDAERRAIEASLRSCGNNISEAARRLGVARITLYRLMRKYQLACGARDSAGGGYAGE
ncbi:MAG: sigma-54 dependent transcriptional regulator [Thiohalobacteraceae bacterium]